MSIARYVNLSFVIVGIVLYIVLGQVFTVLLEMFGSATNAAVLGSNFRLAHLLAMVFGAGLTIFLRRSEPVHGFAMEVGSELSKVTWPTWKETKLATTVVIVTTLVASVILGLLDLAFGLLSRLFYS